MNRQDQRNLLEKLHAELADIELQQQDRTLPHSDQQLLDQAWEDVSNKIDELEEILQIAEEYEEDQWRDAAEYLESESEDSRPPTPRPREPLRFAPPPPPISFAPGDPMYPPPVARTLSCHGVPPLSATRSEVPIPDGWRPFPLPPPITIPEHDGGPSGPPAPRHAARICNCDADGMCAYCEEEQLQQWNAMEDDRVGCRYCAGCMYCSESRYDGADEI